MFSSQQNWSALFSIPCSSTFSVIHVNVDFKKERIGFVVVAFLSLKVRAAMWFTAKMPGCWKCKLSPDLHMKGYGGCTSYRRFSQLKFLRCITKFSCSAAHALHMREVRYKVMGRSCNRPVLHLLFDIIQQIKQKQSLLTGKTFFCQPFLVWFVCLLFNLLTSIWLLHKEQIELPWKELSYGWPWYII